MIVARRVCLLAAGKIKKAEKGRGEKQEVVSGQKWSVANEEALRAKAQQARPAYVSLREVSISPSVLELVLEAVSREDTTIPLCSSGGTLTVVVERPNGLRQV